MKPFDHFTPRTLPEALALLASHAGAMAMAGGTDLHLQMKKGVRQPEAIVSLRRVAELRELAYGDNGLRLGAGVTLRELIRAPEVRAHYPGLVHAAAVLASEQVRSLATVGGNLCNASPAADLAPPLLALDAVAHIAGPQGERELPLAEFFRGPGETALASDELLTALHLPPPRGTMVFQKHSPRQLMDLAVVGVAVRLETAGSGGRTADDEGPAVAAVRVALGAVAPVPLRARRAEALLTGERLTPELVARAAQAAAAECAPIDDVRGAAWYRRRMVAVLVRRGLVAAGGAE